MPAPEDGRVRSVDVCPRCGRERWELVIVPGRFYCDRCGVATAGPNRKPPEPEEQDPQMELM